MIVFVFDKKCVFVIAICISVISLLLVSSQLCITITVYAQLQSDNCLLSSTSSL